jgi:hypothetical protein
MESLSSTLDPRLCSSESSHEAWWQARYDSKPLAVSVCQYLTWHFAIVGLDVPDVYVSFASKLVGHAMIHAMIHAKGRRGKAL